MATYTPTTTSNDAAITDSESVETLLDKWDFIPTHGDITVSLSDTIAFHGAADFEPYRTDAVNDPDDRHENVDVQGFLNALLPYLEEELIIQTVGNIKHRYPLGQRLKIADPETGEVVTSTSTDWREHLKQKARSAASRDAGEETEGEDVEMVTVRVESLETLAAEAENTLEGINDAGFHESQSAESVRDALADAGQALNPDSDVEEHQKSADYYLSQ